MISAAEARKITDDSVSRIKAKEKVEKLSVRIKEHALEGKDSLLLIIEDIQLEDFIIQEFKNLGYTVELIDLYYKCDYSLYRIKW